MMTELNTVLSDFDKLETPITEHSVSSAVRQLRKETDASPPPTEWLAEVMAFDFIENYQNTEVGWGTYFGPMMVWNNQDETATESPSIKRVTPEILSYWEGRTRVAQNPVLRARYADLVWDFAKQRGRGRS